MIWQCFQAKFSAIYNQWYRLDDKKYVFPLIILANCVLLNQFWNKILRGMVNERVFSTNLVYKQLRGCIRGFKILNEECYLH